MALSLRLITSTPVTRSVVPTLVSSSSRFLSISTCHRSYSTTVPENDGFDHSLLRINSPEISKLSFDMEMDDNRRKLTLKIPKEGLSIGLDKPGLKGDNMSLFKQAKTPKEYYFGLDSPDSKTNKDEFKTNIIAHHIISSFGDIGAKLSWDYYDMFLDRSILGKWLCPVIAMRSPVSSFSMYKKEDSERLDIKMCFPGDEKMELTTQGLRVSLNMYGLDRKHIKAYLDYDTLFIEGKTKKKHYITCIHIPQGIYKKGNMIKREVKDKTFYATIPCHVNKEELPQIKAALKAKLYITS